MDRILRAVLLKWPDAKAGFDHYAALIVYEKAGPWLYERTIDGVQPPRKFDRVAHWQLVPAVVGRGVAQRLQCAINSQGYHALLANCEQFARYIVEGNEYSSQVRNAALAIGAVGVLVLASSNSR